MNRLRGRILASLALFLVLGGWLALAAYPPSTVHAEDPAPSDDVPVRKANLTLHFTRTTWWLVKWLDNEIVCNLAVEHDGLPTYNEIEGLCGAEIAQAWQASEPCNMAEHPMDQCPGLYLIQQESEPGQREIEVELPLPEVWVSVDSCDATEGDRRCTNLPNLLFQAQEPLPNETIIDVQGLYNGEPFSCAGAECRLPLHSSGSEGDSIEFWADSSFGDSTQHYTARVRVVPWGDFMDPDHSSSDPASWYVDVLSSQWTGGELASCSYTWNSFPDLVGPPDWLSSPASLDDLSSNNGYYYLAGALIQNGVVDVSACLDGGLQSANVSSTCGVEAARPYLEEWQNRFDNEILQVSADTSVPARLLKNVFARESQVWPGIFQSYKEAGLGQLTEQGADTVLLWNPDFFAQFCPLVLDQSYCALGWGNLEGNEQAILRGALVNKVNASCSDCATGIDISQANYSVRVFAEGLLANCEQTGQVLRNLTGTDPGLSSSYEDLWRFTLVNYNAGPGCLSNAIQAAQSAGEPLDWSHVTSHLEPACQGAIGYVEDISRVLKATPTPTPWLGQADGQASAAENTPEPVIATPTPTATLAAASPSTPTATEEGYDPPPEATSYPNP